MRQTIIIGVSLEGHAFESFPELYGLNCFMKIVFTNSGWQKAVI